MIQDRFILQVLEKLVSNLPQPLHLVLLAHEDPPLPLARLRANNQLTEIRADMANEAIQHALAAADYTLAVHLVESHAMGTILRGHIKTVRGWIRAIPPEWGSQSPRANLAFAWMHVLRGTIAQAAPYLEQLQTIFSGSQIGEQEDTSLQAEWLALQSTVLNAQ